MTFIHRIFFVYLHQLPLIIVYFLPKTHRALICVHFLKITRTPPMPPRHFQQIAPAAIR